MLNSAVRVRAEGTGALIASLPPFLTCPAEDDEFVLTLNGGPAVTYKVERRRFLVDVLSFESPEAPTKTGVTSYIDVIVSVVP